jgi:glycosyltransferase involved in cell wall biosynthesis
MPQLLAINNYYYRRGGSEVVFFEHNRLFEDAGWRVAPFSTRNELNQPSEWSNYFVGESESDTRSPLAKVTRAMGAIYSLEAAHCIRTLIARFKPDIAHAHNVYHHLSPSVLVELHRRNIPVVLTLHDLKLACPAYKMHTQGQICESCRGGALRNVIKRRCIKESTAMSALVWLESTVHKALDVYLRSVDRFITPSRFFLAKFADWGLDTSRFRHVPNSIDVHSIESSDEPGDTFVYVGRLVPEKGVATLIKAAARAGVPLRIIGTGSEEARLRELAARLGGVVEFAGYLTGPALRAAVGSARAVVIPSEWYENAPVSLMEASASQRPVIGADIGGIPELIRDAETGFVFQSASVDSLAAILERVRGLPPERLRNMGRAGREWMRTDFDPLSYRERMLSVYREVGIVT